MNAACPPAARAAFRPVPRRRSPTVASGVTLIELMVGLAVGLVLTLVITQVLSVAEGQKRSTSAGTDAQVNGAVALYTVQRDLQMAGYGLTARPEALGCLLAATIAPAVVPPNPRLVPVRIENGVDGAPDQLMLLSSGHRRYALPVGLEADHARDATAFNVPTAMGVQPGDLMVAVPVPHDDVTGCTLFGATTATLPTSPYYCEPLDAAPVGVEQVRHDACDGGSRWNAAPGDSVFPAAGVSRDGFLLNLGPQDAGNRFFRLYDVDARGLRLRSLAGDGTEDEQALFPEIVNLQVFYGKDDDANGTVERYDTVAPATNDEWRHVQSVRVALVARSGQYEREVVTAANPTWDVGTAAEVEGSEACGASRCVTLRVDWRDDLAANDLWKHYRYKVFDTVVPLRNLIWNSTP